MPVRAQTASKDKVFSGNTKRTAILTFESRIRRIAYIYYTGARACALADKARVRARHRGVPELFNTDKKADQSSFLRASSLVLVVSGEAPCGLVHLCLIF
jgi:hypothetical protein